MKSERPAGSSLMKMAPQNDFYDKSKQSYAPSKGSWFESVKKGSEKDKVLSAKNKA